MKKPIKTLSIEQVREAITEASLPGFRANQILQWVYGKGVSSYEEMSNLPKEMRAQLSEAFPLYSPEIVQRRESIDGTVKYLLGYQDGALVETVGLPSDDGRLTVCASSQSGCSMGCAFCATGKAGFTRHLFPGEIVDQVLVVQEDFGKRVTNVVVMGQGEPFLNYGNTISALRILNDGKLLNIGARHITVSTCGIIDGIKRLSTEPEQFTLAVSLHAANQKTRDLIMPGLKHQKLGNLRKSLVEYTESTGRRVTFEYALMKSVNDSEDDLVQLIQYCKRLLCHVNLIPLNNVPGSDFAPVPYNRMDYWNTRLLDEGIVSSIRKSRGSDIAAACGQLASEYE